MTQKLSPRKHGHKWQKLKTNSNFVVFKRMILVRHFQFYEFHNTYKNTRVLNFLWIFYWKNVRKSSSFWRIFTRKQKARTQATVTIKKTLIRLINWIFCWKLKGEKNWNSIPRKPKLKILSPQTQNSGNFLPCLHIFFFN